MSISSHLNIHMSTPPSPSSRPHSGTVLSIYPKNMHILIFPWMSNEIPIWYAYIHLYDIRIYSYMICAYSCVLLDLCGHTCIYLCVYVCIMYLYIYTHMHIYVDICTYSNNYVCLNVNIYKYTYIYIIDKN
jgi:hypothetical protein